MFPIRFSSTAVLTPPVSVDQKSEKQKEIEMIGHRGVRTLADSLELRGPENTKEALLHAADMGASVEFDVHAIAGRAHEDEKANGKFNPDQLIIHHDDDTGRVFTFQNKPDKSIRHLQSNEVGDLQVNSNIVSDLQKMYGNQKVENLNPLYMATQMPNTKDTIKALLLHEKRPHLYLEIKSVEDGWQHKLKSLYDPQEERHNYVERRVVQLIHDLQNDEDIQERGIKVKDRITVISFSRSSLRLVNEVDPGIKLGLDYDMFPPFITKGQFERLKHDGIDIFLPSFSKVSKRQVNVAHEQGIAVVPWVNGQTRAEEAAWFPKLQAMGVDGIVTNALDLLKKHFTPDASA